MRTTCRICGSPLEDVLDLGLLYPSGFVSDGAQHEKQPLTLTQCQGDCGLVQLRHTFSLDAMYRTYWYRSALNWTMVQALQDVVDKVEDKAKLKDGDVVVDIGANDGTLLSLYKNKKLFRVGFDPARNLREAAEIHCDVFVNDYFSYFMTPPSVVGKVRVVTSIAMFYDLEDPNVFVRDVKNILADDGLWVIQLTDLVSMLKINAFDSLCFEHLEYYSLSTLDKLLKMHGMKTVAVEHNTVNGGSIRAYVMKDLGGVKVERSWSDAREAEAKYLVEFTDPLAAFGKRIEAIRETLVGFITGEVERGKKVYALGASTKGNTLLQYCGLDSSLITAAAEVNPDKFGLWTIGTRIPIVPEDKVFAKKPDYFLVLPWHFVRSFVERNAEYLETGGMFIVPMPTPTLYSMCDGEVVKTPLTGGMET